MTTYTMGDRVLVRVLLHRGEREAEVIEDRGDSVRVILADDKGATIGGPRETVRKDRCRPVPTKEAPRRVEALMSEPVATQVLAAVCRPLVAVPKPPKPWRSASYLTFVRARECCVARDHATVSNCAGPVVAHHHGPRGMGQKTDDSRTVPLCDGHHREFHDHGTIVRWPREALDRYFMRVQSEILTAWVSGPSDAHALIVDTLTAHLRSKEEA